MVIKRIANRIKKHFRQYSVFYPKKSHDALRWGIIGLGNMAEVFATALDDDRDSKIVAVASRSKTKAVTFAAKHGHGKAYGSYEEMLSDTLLKLDVVYVATPAKYHAEHIKLCLESGNNVLCEKPITSNTAELKALMELADRKGLFLMEGMWMKCLPTFIKAKEWLRQGLVGRLELVKVDFYKREIIRPELSIFNPAEGGGVMHDYGVYSIAFATEFLGEEVNVMQRHVRYSSFGIDADWQIYLRNEGAEAYISLSSDYKGDSKAALIGEKGVIEWDAQFNRSNKIVLYNKYGNIVEEYIASYKNEGFEYEIAEVNNCIRSGKKQSEKVSLGKSLETIMLIDCLVKSEKK